MSRSQGAAALKIAVLGGFEVVADGRPVGAIFVRNRSARRLLVTLALAPGRRLARGEVIASLWPGSDPASAANRLYKAAHAVRRALEPDLPPRGDSRFLATGDAFGLRGDVEVDALRFERLARAALVSRATADLDAALSGYAGDLLPDDLHEAWTSEPRERLRSLRRELLAALASGLESEGRFDASADRYAELLSHDHADEEAHRGLMRVHAARGRSDRALDQYRACRVALARERGVEPGPETVRLGDRIAGEARPEPSASEGGALPAPARRRGRLAVVAVALACTVAVSLATFVVVAPQRAARLAAKLERFERRSSDAKTSDGSDPRRAVSLRGRVPLPYVRVEVLDSASGLAAFADADGEFFIPNAVKGSEASPRLVLTRVGGSAEVARLVLPSVTADCATAEAESVAVTTPLSGAELRALRGSTASAPFDAENAEFYRGVFAATTAGSDSDEARLVRLNAFVASTYVEADTPSDARPRSAFETGTHWSGTLALAFATVARSAGFDVRFVDMSSASAEGGAYSAVEVRYDGGWHLFDPAYGACARAADGRVLSYAEIARRPDHAPVAEATAPARRGWTPGRIVECYRSGLHRLRYFDADLAANADLFS